MRTRIVLMVLGCTSVACGARGEDWERELGKVDALLREQRAAQAVTALEARCTQGRGFAREVTNGYRLGFFFWQALGSAYQARDTLHGPESYRALQQAAHTCRPTQTLCSARRPRNCQPHGCTFT